MEFDHSLYDYDVGYYEYIPGLYLPGKLPPAGGMSCPARAVDAALRVPLNSSDVLLASYPKTGQTWLMTILRYVLESKDLEAGKEANLHDLFGRMPMIEVEYEDGSLGAEKFSDLTSPRFIKTHLPYKLWIDQLEKHQDLKVIQNIRNPKDMLVSYYHHCRSGASNGAFNGTWDQFFEVYAKKHLGFGDFFENISEWYKFNMERENSLVLEYEEMKKDLRSHVVKIAKFIGQDISEKAIDIVVEKSGFKKASAHLNSMFKDSPLWNSKRSSFVRKGEVGDFKNYFSQEQSDYVDQEYKKYLEPLGITLQYSI